MDAVIESYKPDRVPDLLEVYDRKPSRPPLYGLYWKAWECWAKDIEGRLLRFTDKEKAGAEEERYHEIDTYPQRQRGAQQGQQDNNGARGSYGKASALRQVHQAVKQGSRSRSRECVSGGGRRDN